MSLTNKRGVKIVLWVLAGLVAGLLPLIYDHNHTGVLNLDPDQLGILPLLESPYAYLYLHLFTFVPVFALSFDRRVGYYKAWGALLPAIIIVGTIFIVWDVYFTYAGVWGFNEDYLSGYYLFKLPVEEWLFFVTVPFACIFIYECLNYYVSWNPFVRIEKQITASLLVLALLLAIVYRENIYTAITFALCAWLLSLHLFSRASKSGTLLRSRFYMAYVVSCVPFVLVNGALTGGFTDLPIVLYNDTENLGQRLGSIPFDDFGYSFLLLLGTTSVYEWFKKKTAEIIEKQLFKSWSKAFFKKRLRKA